MEIALKNDRKGSGRTTGLILQSIGVAVANPGTETEFIDHSPASVEGALVLKRKIEDVIKDLRLKSVSVRLEESNIYIKSMYKQRSPGEEAYYEVMGYYPDHEVNKAELHRMLRFAQAYKEMER